MVTAILPSLTDDGPEEARHGKSPSRYSKPDQRLSVAYSVESEVTITPERYYYTRPSSNNSRASQEQQQQDVADATYATYATYAGNAANVASQQGKPSTLAGFVGLFTGCGALVALTLFLPLPAKFGEREGVTPAQAVSYSFYVVGGIALAVGLFVLIGLRDLKGEEGKGWKALLGKKAEPSELTMMSTEDGGDGNVIGNEDESRSQRQVCIGHGLEGYARPCAGLGGWMR